MSITLEQYRASIGGFTPPGLLKRRKAAAWRELLGEEVVDRMGREGHSPLGEPLYYRISKMSLLRDFW